MTKIKKLETEKPVEQILNGEILDRYDMFYDKQGNSKGVENKIHGLRVKHNVVMNMKELKRLATPMLPESFIPVSEDMQKYDAAIRELYQKLSEGKTTTFNGQEIYDIKGKEKEFKEAVETLNEQYKDAIEDRKKQIDEFNEYLSQPFDKETRWYTFDIEELDVYKPEDENAVYNAVSWMIK